MAALGGHSSRRRLVGLAPSFRALSVLARIQPANAASIRVAKRLGLALAVRTTDRVGKAIAIYRQTRSDWRAPAGQ
jgi:RimJ/RimL family protein N-acetyltransferase